MSFGGQCTVWKLILAQATEAVPAGAAENGGSKGSPLGSMLPLFVAFIAIMYFLMIRPQQKRDKERRELLGALAKGDGVVTTGGMCGTIVGLSESNVVLRVDDGVTVEFLRSAIAQVVKEGDEGKKSK